MAESKGGATATIGVEKDLPPLEKSVSDMSDEERETAKKKVIEHLEARQAEGNESFLEIEIEDPEYPGVLKIKRPSCDEQRKIGLRSAQYLQGQVNVDIKTENLAIFFAAFDVCVDWESAPEWFKPREIFDYALLEHIYGRWAKWIASFRGFVQREHKGDSETPSSPDEVVGAESLPGSTNG